MEKTVGQQQAEPRFALVYETPHYRVVVGKMSGPEDTPMELRVKYLIQHKRHGVILGTTSSYGMAVATALEEEGRHLAADEVAASAEARGFALVRDDSPPSSGTKQ